MSSSSDMRGDGAVLIAALLLAVTVIASLVPAYRAASVNPVAALQQRD